MIMCADNYNQLQEGDSSVSSKEDANAVVIPWQLLHPMRTQMLPTLTSAFDSASKEFGKLFIQKEKEIAKTCNDVHIFFNHFAAI